MYRTNRTCISGDYATLFRRHCYILTFSNVLFTISKSAFEPLNSFYGNKPVSEKLGLAYFVFPVNFFSAYEGTQKIKR